MDTYTAIFQSGLICGPVYLCPHVSVNKVISCRAFDYCLIGYVPGGFGEIHLGSVAVISTLIFSFQSDRTEPGQNLSAWALLSWLHSTGLYVCVWITVWPHHVLDRRRALFRGSLTFPVKSPAGKRGVCSVKFHVFRPSLLTFCSFLLHSSFAMWNKTVRQQHTWIILVFMLAVWSILHVVIFSSVIMVTMKSEWIQF